MKRFNLIVVITLALLVVIVQAQNIEFEVDGAAHPFYIEEHGWGDPALFSENNYGKLGTQDNQLWEIHTNKLWVNGAVVTSDERKKENIVEIPNVVEKLKNVRTVTYDYKASKYGDVKDPKKKAEIEKFRKNHVGFLAQNLLTEFPELVEHDENTDVFAVNYNGMIPILLKAIKEQQTQIEELKKEVATIK